MSHQDNEPFNLNFRYDTIVSTIKAIANNHIILEIIPDDWTPQALESYKKSAVTFGKGLKVFTDPKSTQEQKEMVESETFMAIIELKAANILKPVIDRDKLEIDIARIDLKQDALSALLKEILIVLSAESRCIP